MKQQENHYIIKLGALEISRENCTIATGGAGGSGETKVSPRSMDVLLYLIEHNERVISAEELLDRFWSSLASDHAVHKAIAELRAAMGDSVRRQHHIKTVPKRGYKLLTQVLAGEPAQKPRPSLVTQLRQQLVLMSWRQVVVCAALITAAAGFGMFAEQMRRGDMLNAQDVMTCDISEVLAARMDATGG